MELRAPTAALLFFGSYFPLALILFVQDADTTALKKPLCRYFLNFSDNCIIPLSNPGISISVLFCSAICLAIFLFSIRSIPFTNEVDVQESKHIPADLMSYVFPYIVSFMSFDYQSLPKMIGALIFLFWMYLITYRSGSIVLNPLLAAFGWRLYEIKFRYPTGQNSYQKRAMSRSEIIPDQRYEVFSFQDIFITNKKRR